MYHLAKSLYLYATSKEGMSPETAHLGKLADRLRAEL